MTLNRYTGEAPISLAGEPHTLVYDFRALADIASLDEQLKFTLCFGNRTALLAFLTDNLGHLPAIVAAGLRARHGAMAAEQVAAGLAPLRPALNATADAIWAAIEGPDPQPKTDALDENPPMAMRKTGPRATLWWWPFARPSSPA